MSLPRNIHNLTCPAKQIIQILDTKEKLIAIYEDVEMDCDKLYIYELSFITYINNIYYYYHSIWNNKYDMIKHDLTDVLDTHASNIQILSCQNEKLQKYIYNISI